MAKNIIMNVLTTAGYEAIYPFNPAMILNATFLETSVGSQYNITITGIPTPLTNLIGNNMGIITFIPTITNDAGVTLSINGDIARPIVYADGSLVESDIFKPNSFVYLKYQNEQFYLLLGKDQLGLSNVDNTSDMDKPISVATQDALNEKLNIPQLVPAGANLNDYKTAGMYYNLENSQVNQIANVPTPKSFSLLVEKHAGAKQTFTTYQTNGIQTWTRNFYNGSWSSWYQVGIILSGTSNPTPDIGLDGNIYIKVES